MARRAAKVDSNQKQIVNAFRSLGWSVLHLHAVGEGCPDLLVGGLPGEGGERVSILVEVKSPGGKLRASQLAFLNAWRGPWAVVRSVEDVVALTGREVQT